MWQILSRPPRLCRPTEKLTKLVRNFNETRSLKGGLRLNGGEHELSTKGTFMTLTPEELAERIAERYDPDFLIEILGITSQQILQAFMEEFVAQRHKFKDDEDNETKAPEEE